MHDAVFAQGALSAISLQDCLLQWHEVLHLQVCGPATANMWRRRRLQFQAEKVHQVSQRISFCTW